MKFKLFPVIVTAAATSVMTMYAVSHFQGNNTPYFLSAATPKVPVNYATYTGSGAAAPVNFENAAEGSVKAVAHIKTSTKARVGTTEMDDVFSQLFGQRQYYIPPQMGSGSGVMISPDGYMVTNNHVVANADEVTVTFNDRYTAKAKVVGADPATDIAVLKVENAKDMPFMEFGNSDDVKLGQWVLAVGYPLTLDATVTAGIVSAKGRSLGINRTQTSGGSPAIESFIQTDAAVNPGNSGGALVNTAGQLIGINSAIASPTGSYAGYSYAIPANIVRKAVNDLIKYGSVQRAYLGIEYVDPKTATPDQIEALGLDKFDGVYVNGVRQSSGALKAGITKGDFITHINGQPVNNSADIQGQIARFKPGDNVSVNYNRGGKTYTTTILLTNSVGTTDLIKGTPNTRLLGASFRQLTKEEKTSYRVDGGVMVTEIDSKGAIAQQTKMKKGFVITGANSIPVTCTGDLQTVCTRNKNVQIAGFYPGVQGMYYYGVNNVEEVGKEE
jgi:serine protease Do